MKSVMCVLALTTLFMAQNSGAQVAQDHFGRNPHQADKVRHQYYEAEVPDGVVFQSLLTRVSDRYGGDTERTVRKVKNKMDFATDAETRRFISVLDEQQKHWSVSKLSARSAVICHSDPRRTKDQMFRDVDALSDISIPLANHSYDRFVASLDAQLAAKFSAWVTETKGGYQYYVFKAESALKEWEDNPATYYQEECSRIEGKLRVLR